MEIGDKVIWLHSRLDSDDQGWAGSGAGAITNYDPARRYFGGPVGSGNPGPAVEITLAHNGMTAWVSPDDVMPDLKVVAA